MPLQTHEEFYEDLMVFWCKLRNQHRRGVWNHDCQEWWDHGRCIICDGPVQLPAKCACCGQQLVPNPLDDLPLPF
jgi:hypothetical protein